MSVELPSAPVDTVIRRNASGLRVSADAVDALARRIQSHGSKLAVDAAAQATAEGRKTIMPEDFDSVDGRHRDELTLPVAPVDRIARLDIEDRYRIAMNARVTLADILERYADDVATAAATLAHHADRRTIKGEDVDVYFELAQYY